MQPFSQSKDTFKITFTTRFQFIEIFEEIFQQLFSENLLSISLSEIESKTIESEPEDLWSCEAYINYLPDTSILAEIAEIAREKSADIIGSIKIEKIEDQDWVSQYQQNLKPLEIGSFFVSSLMNKHLCPPDKKGIFIEAARAFGTGDHATTSGCIEAIESLQTQDFKDILDLGCGSGILGFAAEHIWPEAQIFACDIEEVAVEIARENGIVNGSSVVFYQNTENQIVQKSNKGQKFNLIISNILAGPLIDLSTQIRDCIKVDGYIILSGFLENQLPEIQEVYEKIGFKTINIINKSPWIILVAKVKSR